MSPELALLRHSKIADGLPLSGEERSCNGHHRDDRVSADIGRIKIPRMQPSPGNHWVRQGVVLAPGGVPPQPLRKPTYPARETLARSVCQGLLLRSHTPPAGGL